MAAKSSKASAKRRAKSRTSAAAASVKRQAAAPTQPAKRKRGRPPGSKNNPNATPRPLVYILGPNGRPVLRGRGRPPLGAIFVNADGTPIGGTAGRATPKAAATPAKTAKRGPGRPPKAASSSPAVGAPKRGRGRPRKVAAAAPAASAAAAPAASAATAPKRGRGRPRKAVVSPTMAPAASAPAPVRQAPISRGASSLRATVVQSSAVTFLSTGATGNIASGSSVFVDGRAVFSDGSGLCVIPGSLIFVDTSSSPDLLGLAVTGSNAIVRVAFDVAPNESAAPYKAVIANFRR